MGKNCFRLILFLVTTISLSPLAFPDPIVAEPITYTFLATGSGIFSSTTGNTEFTDAPFVITSVGNTAGVHLSYCYDETHCTYHNDSLSAKIYIAGVGLGTIIEYTFIFVNQNDLAIGFTSETHGDLLDIHNYPEFQTWDLIEPIGPMFYATPGPVNQFHDVITSLGLLTFSSYRNATFFTTSPAFPQDVAIDVKPKSPPNNVNRNKLDQIPVAILSGPYLYAPDHVDDGILTFGQTGDEESFAYCADRPKDVNADGLKDLVCYFNTRIAGFQCGDIEGILKGRTVDGRFIEGVDSVRIIPCK